MTRIFFTVDGDSVPMGMCRILRSKRAASWYRIERGGRGVFTSYLIEALSGDADYNGDGFVSASEIGAFVPSAVTQATDGRQTPRFGTLEGSGEVVFDLP